MPLDMKEYNIIKAALAEGELTPRQAQRAQALIEAQERTDKGQSAISHAKTAVGNFAASVLGLPGDLVALATGEDNFATSASFAPELGGDPEHLSFLPSQILAPGPGEFKAIAAMAGAGATRRGVATAKAKLLNKAFMKAREVEKSQLNILERIAERQSMHPDELYADDVERVTEIIRGSEKAFEPIYRTYNPLVEDIARETLRKKGFDKPQDMDRVEDITQAVWRDWLIGVRKGEIDPTIPVGATFKSKDGPGRNLIRNAVYKDTREQFSGFPDDAARAKANKTSFSLDESQGTGTGGEDIKMQNLLNESGELLQNPTGEATQYFGSGDAPSRSLGEAPRYWEGKANSRPLIDAELAESRNIMVEEIMQLSPTVQERMGPALTALAVRDTDSVTEAAKAYGLKEKTLRTHWKKIKERTNKVLTGQRDRVPFKDRLPLSDAPEASRVDRIPKAMIPASRNVASDQKALEATYRELKKLDEALKVFKQKTWPKGTVVPQAEQDLARETYNRITGRMNNRRRVLIQRGEELAEAIRKATAKGSK